MFHPSKTIIKYIYISPGSGFAVLWVGVAGSWGPGAGFCDQTYVPEPFILGPGRGRPSNVAKREIALAGGPGSGDGTAAVKIDPEAAEAFRVRPRASPRNPGNIDTHRLKIFKQCRGVALAGVWPV